MNIYEQSVRMVHWFFGALIALSLNHLFRDQRQSFGVDAWPALLLCTFLFLRYLIGSANHMWYEYAIKKSENLTARLLRDFIFVIVYAFLAVRITDAADIRQLIFCQCVLLAVGVAWTATDKFLTFLRSSWKKQRRSLRGRWDFWLVINILQLLSALVVFLFGINEHRIPWIEWSVSLAMLVVIYFVLLVFDMTLQFRTLARMGTDFTATRREENGAVAAQH